MKPLRTYYLTEIEVDTNTLVEVVYEVQENGDVDRIFPELRSSDMTVEELDQWLMEDIELGYNSTVRY